MLDVSIEYLEDTEEQRQLFELHAKYGNKWTDIARQMPGRYLARD